MKTIEFFDADGNRIRVQESSSIQPSYRIYIKFANNIGEIPENDDWNHGLHLRENQAKLLICALQDLINDNENA
jgi:hypothetical protein